MRAALRHHGLSSLAVALGGVASNGFGVSDLLPVCQSLKMSRVGFREYMGIAWYLATRRLNFRDH